MPVRRVPPTAGHLGQGVAYPLRYESNGRLALSSGNQSVADAMSAICQTAPGERVMQPDNGGAVGLFEPVTDSSLMTQTIRQVVAEHEPRVEPDSIDVAIERVDSTGKIEVTVTYQIKGEADASTLTFPYWKVTSG